MSDSTSLGDRMKRYELASQAFLTPRMPAILRFDGKAFHTLTRGMGKPYDELFIGAMERTAIELCAEIQGAKIGYIQSDEISVLLTDYDDIGTQGWFDYEIAKMISVGAALCAVAFSETMGARGLFDGRAFSVPREDVCNYFLWRQRDATRNSIQGYAQQHFSPREMTGKTGPQLQEMMFAKTGFNWNDAPTHHKRGACVTREVYEKEPGVERSRWVADREPPIFSQRRDYIERFTTPQTASTP